MKDTVRVSMARKNAEKIHDSINTAIKNKNYSELIKVSDYSCTEFEKYSDKVNVIRLKVNIRRIANFSVISKTTEYTPKEYKYQTRLLDEKLKISKNIIENIMKNIEEEGKEEGKTV